MPDAQTPVPRDLASLAEAFLFMEGGTVSRKSLAAKLKIETHALEGILDELASRLGGRGVTLIRTETEVSLAAAPAVSAEIEGAYAEDKEIGDAGLEVLAIILYRGASTKSQIDYIRGVNTGTTLRGLLSRGLIERAGNPADSREYLYRPTTELLAHLGLTRTQDLPEYAKITATLATFETTQKASEKNVFEQNHGTESDTGHPADTASHE